MAGLISDPIVGNTAAEYLGLDAFKTTTGDVVGAQAEEILHSNTLTWLARQAARQGYETGGFTDNNGGFIPIEQNYKTLSPEEATAQYGIKDGAGRSLLDFTDATPEPVAKQLYDLKREKLLREDTLNRAEGGLIQTPLKYGTALLTSLLDPVNVAAAFIPVVGEARYAAWLVEAGGAFGRAGIRAGVGAAQGALGTAALQPLEYAKSMAEHNDLTMHDALVNTIVGSVLGGGLHTGFGAIGDGITGKFSNILADASADTKEAAMRAAVAAVTEGRPIQVDTLFRSEAIGRMLDQMPVLAERDARLISEEAQLKATDATLADRLGKLPEGDPTAVETLARLSEVERQLKDETISPELRRELSSRRDELLTDTNPDKLQQAALPIEERRTIEGRRTSIADRLAQIATERNRASADTALSPLPKVQDVAAQVNQARARLETDLRGMVQTQKVAYAHPEDVAISREVANRVAQDATKPATTEAALNDAQRALDEATASLKAHQQAGRLTDGDLHDFNGADTLINDAESKGRAFEAAASCLASGT
jgi:hypothetical protein